jgi:hypothetical protein
VPGDDKRDGPSATKRPPQEMPTSTTASLPHAGDPRPVGELLACWVGVKLAEVDGLVDEARSRVDAIPDQRRLWLLLGEALVRLHVLELEVAELKRGRR